MSVNQVLGIRIEGKVRADVIKSDLRQPRIGLA